MRCPQPGLLEVSTSDKDPTGVDLTNAELKAFQDNWSKGSPCPERTFSSFSWIAAFTKVVRIPTFSPFTQRLLFGSWTPACRRRAKPRGRHMVPMRLTNTPLWLYFRSVRSSEKSVKL